MITKKDLGRVTVGGLRGMANRHAVSSKGTKQELVDRLAEYYDRTSWPENLNGEPRSEEGAEEGSSLQSMLVRNDDGVSTRSGSVPSEGGMADGAREAAPSREENRQGVILDEGANSNGDSRGAASAGG